MTSLFQEIIIKLATVLPYSIVKGIYHSKIGNYFVSLIVHDTKFIKVPVGDNLFMYLDLQNPKDWIRVKGGDEKSVQRIFRNKLKEGDVVIDAGANTGNYTMPAAQIVGGKGKVIAIEPSELPVKILRKNIELNNFENVLIYECALGEKENKSILHESDSSMMGYLSNMKPKKIEIKDSKEIEIKTLDGIIKEINSEIQVLKLDIEGSEFLALQGAKQSLEKALIKNIICEVHAEYLKEFGFSDTMLLDFLKTYGYKIKIIEKNVNRRYHILAYRN